MSRIHLPRWLAPWKWAPLILVLGLQVAVGNVSLDATFLVLPIAVHMALRYGKAGWTVVAVSALPLLTGITMADSFRTAPAVGVYASAVILGWWLCRRGAGDRLVLPRFRLTPWVYVALFLLPVRLGLGSVEAYGLEDLWIDEIRWVVDGYTVFFLLVFALGASRVPARPLLIALTLFAVVGTALEYLPLPSTAAELFRADRAEIPGLGLTGLRPLFIHYRFDSPAQWLTAVAFFAFGRFLAGQREDGGLPAIPWRFVQLGSLALLALGGYVNAYLSGEFGPALTWLGSYHALLLASVVGGLYFGFGGILALCLLVTAFSGIDALARANLLDLSGVPITFDLGDFLIVYAFGALGIRIRDALSNAATTLWSGAWARFLAIYLVLLLAVIPLERPSALLFVAGAFFGGAAVALALSALRDRLTEGEIRLKGGWISLASVLMLAYLAYSFAAENWETLQQAAQQSIALATQLVVAAEALDDESVMMLSFVAPAFLLLLWTFGSTIEKLVETSRQLVTDVRTVLDRWRRRLPVVIRVLPPAAEPPSATPGQVPPAAVRTLSWVNRSLLAAAVAAPLCLIGYNTWLDYREELARELEDRGQFGEGLGGPFEDERDGASREYESARAEFMAELIRAGKATLKAFPGLDVHTGPYDTTIGTGWRLDPSDASVRRRVVVTLQPALDYEDMPLEQAVSRSLWVHAYRQDRGLFGFWVEGAWDRPIMDEIKFADAIEQAIEEAAVVLSSKGERQ